MNKKIINEIIEYIESKHGIKIRSYKFSCKDKYVIYFYGFDGEVIGAWNNSEVISGSDYPYTCFEMRLIGCENKKINILGDVIL